MKCQCQQIVSACRLKKIVEIYNKINKDSLPIFLDLQYNGIRLIKILKDSKRKNQKKITLFS